MKLNLLFFLLLFVGKQTFAQFTNSLIETEFPTLDLPFTTKGLLADKGLLARPVDLNLDKFLKADVTKELKYYDKKSYYFEDNSKCYALGKFTINEMVYLLFVESSPLGSKKDFGFNRVLMFSLDKSHQLSNYFTIAEFVRYTEKTNTLYQSRDSYWSFIDKNKALYAVATDAKTKLKSANQADGPVSLEETKYLFDNKGNAQAVK